jgi:hypothetical protein
MFHKIKTIEPNAENHSIKITYHDNVVIAANFDVEKGVMTLLKNPETFKKVEIGNNGRSIIWREFDIDFCADSLRLKFYQETNHD